MQSRYENLAKSKFMISTPQKHGPPGNFLVVQWLGLKCFHCRGPVSVTGWRTKIPQVMWCDQKKKHRVLFWLSLSLNGIIIHCNLNYPWYCLLSHSDIQSFNYLTILPPKSKSTSIYSVLITHLLSIGQKKLVLLRDTIPSLTLLHHCS